MGSGAVFVFMVSNTVFFGRDHPFINCKTFFRKTFILYPLICISTAAYQGLGNASWEKLAYALNWLSLLILSILFSVEVLNQLNFSIVLI